ncbi:hypothetical protein F3Y22_tig00015426pilonHSYRG00066 [Hibiscus syriacus]|uniref:pyruvate kinase n=1 Tax=Hibiscus syriacus TaxID=106335 RepID=A0A6A3BYH0_HIBSY|nr:hypothetical protein F3Y22_tig00015426pilonHSYRG00066 [Hibiscus syriacus]
MIWKLAEAGMNVARLIMSHGDHASHQKVIDLVKEYNAQSKVNTIAILLDTMAKGHFFYKIIAGIVIFDNAFIINQYDCAKFFLDFEYKFSYGNASTISWSKTSKYVQVTGPEVRSGGLPQPITLTTGQEFTFTIRRGVGTTDCVGVNYDDFVNDVEVGDMLLVDVIESKTATMGLLMLLAGLSSAVLPKHKHQNLAGSEQKYLVELSLRFKANVHPPIIKQEFPVLNSGMISLLVKSKTKDSVKCKVVDGEKDWDDIKFGVDNKVDLYVVSFVKDAEVVHELKNYLQICDADIHVIVKIESANSIPNLHSIITASDGNLPVCIGGDFNAYIDAEEKQGKSQIGIQSISLDHLCSKLISLICLCQEQFKENVLKQIFRSKKFGEQLLPLKALKLLARMVLPWASIRRLRGVVFKVDFCRAYETVDWQILLRLLEVMGFGERWCSWISQCISTASISVLVNGSPTEEFPIAKGLRQGCSLSLLLFNVVGELLHMMLSKAVEIGLFQGFSFGKNQNNFTLSYLQFADDTIIFCGTSITQIKNARQVLRIYSLMKGLHLNLAESRLFGINVEDDIMEDWASAIRCSRGKNNLIFALSPIQRGKVVDFGSFDSNGWEWNIKTMMKLCDWEVVQLMELFDRLKDIKLTESLEDCLVPPRVEVSYGKFPINKYQNEIIFDGGKLDRFTLLFMVRLRPVVCWSPPPADFYKINVDGVVCTVGRIARIGGILRDWNRTKLMSFSENVGPTPIILVELKAIKKGIDIFVSSEWASKERLIVESDCKLAVEWLKDQAIVPTFLTNLVKEIASTIFVYDIFVRWISRCYNYEVDKLAKDGIG